MGENWSSMPYTFQDPKEDEYKNGTVLMKITSPPTEASQHGNYTRKPEVTEESTFFFQKDEGEKNAMFSPPGYYTLQWRPNPNHVDGGDDPLTFEWVYVDATLFKNHIADAWGITDPADWIRFGPKLVQNMEGVMIGYTNKTSHEKTM